MATPVDAYLQECQNLLIPPLPYLQKLLQSHVTELNLTGIYIGDKQAIALSTALKQMRVTKFIAPLNGLMNSGVRSILLSLESRGIELIDLSRNDFAPSCVKDICRVIVNTLELQEVKVVMCSHLKPEHVRKIQEAFIKRSK
ncbi:hypothetical protein SS50377_23651 [Spironucleus salmonicida]|uniref:Uncharacterized protein n=1 Tax=Spironucleus salmonicida TaxID=348837 RepID=V6M5J4_9EUKA|nr:hypothetical protein SS50377_23651 [Spironucleus salmonicida]|eukprot:EST48634.1 Hypothetical protein SS50377_11247 [Spironucleus salmonicida]